MSGFWLRVRAKTPRDFRVYDGAIIGRLPDCAVYLPHKSVSRRHAVLRVVGNLVHVEDQGSSNGTFVNGQAVEHGTLIVGDELRIGAVPLTLIADEEEAAPGDVARPAIEEVPPSGDDAFATHVDDEDDDRFELDDDLEELTLPGFAEEAPAAPPAAKPTPRQSVPRLHAEPEITVRTPSAPSSRPEPAPAAPGETHHTSRVLQYRKRADRGFLGTDLSQWSGPQRLLALLGVLVVAGVLFYLAAFLTGSL
ncbi:MAG: FHA domain-containing protein [Planctomycetes bacterium]|nr:FHA domain-containing protein [Planctomycetota bacterium]